MATLKNDGMEFANSYLEFKAARKACTTAVSNNADKLPASMMPAKILTTALATVLLVVKDFQELSTLNERFHLLPPKCLEHRCLYQSFPKDLMKLPTCMFFRKERSVY
jgi:hypothetical protein